MAFNKGASNKVVLACFQYISTNINHASTPTQASWYSTNYDNGCRCMVDAKIALLILWVVHAPNKDVGVLHIVPWDF
jgi:hypothetical protein